MNVLLVEDNPQLQTEIAEYVRMAGHSVTVTDNGETAVQLVELSGADLIICDIEMPGLNGFETVSIIREFLGQHWVPIIFLTQRDHVDDFLQAFQAGADDYIVKPVNQHILQAKMKVMERFMLMQQQLNEIRNAPDECWKFDKLTHTYCSDHFLDLAMLNWAILSRQKMPGSLLMVKIDYYPQYQEYYGQSSADQCLSDVGKVLTSGVHRPSDFVGRFAEDEFMLLLPDTGESGAARVAERIRCNVESLNIEHKRSRVLGVVSVSIGVSSSANLRSYDLQKNIVAATGALQSASKKGDHIELVKLSSMATSGI